MSSAAGSPSDGTTVVDVIAGYEADGYTAQLSACEGGTIRCFACHEDSPAGEATVDSLRRTEGASDPDDMVAVVALCCPRCGAKGTAVLKYGPEASIEDSEVLSLLEDRTRLDGDRASGGIGAGGGGLLAEHDPPA